MEIDRMDRNGMKCQGSIYFVKSFSIFISKKFVMILLENKETYDS